MTRLVSRPPPGLEPEPELLRTAEALAEDEQIIERPNGYFWVAPDGRQEFGPFETREAARADRYMADDEAPEPGESLFEAESEIGIAQWIDPDTGAPAEGLSPPHLDRE